jgi:hypothetical protein
MYNAKAFVGELGSFEDRPERGLIQVGNAPLILIY